MWLNSKLISNEYQTFTSTGSGSAFSYVSWQKSVKKCAGVAIKMLIAFVFTSPASQTYHPIPCKCPKERSPSQNINTVWYSESGLPKLGPCHPRKFQAVSNSLCPPAPAVVCIVPKPAGEVNQGLVGLTNGAHLPREKKQIKHRGGPANSAIWRPVTPVSPRKTNNWKWSSSPGHGAQLGRPPRLLNYTLTCLSGSFLGHQKALQSRHWCQWMFPKTWEVTQGEGGESLHSKTIQFKPCGAHSTLLASLQAMP